MSETIQELRTWRARVSARSTFLFFEMLTTAGRTGTGEATMSGDDPGAVAVATRLFDRLLDGRSLDDIPQAVDQLVSTPGTRDSLVTATAVSALEQCIWDLRGQARGLPVHELLGGARRDAIRLYANINRGTAERGPDGFAAAAAGAIAAGFDAVKCAPFDGVAPDHDFTDTLVQAGLERIRAVRAAAPHAQFMVDCHGRLGAGTARRIIPILGELSIFWLEEPLATNPHTRSMTSREEGRDAMGGAPTVADPDLAWLNGCGIPIAGGEFEYGLDGFDALLRRVPLSFMMPDVKHSGGVWTTTALGTVAASRGIGFAPHNPSGPISTVVSMHICAAVPRMEMLEYQWGEVAGREMLVTPAEPRERGILTRTEAPGLGVALNHDALRNLLIPIG
jgi:galactonate dehydratase